jgi:hypothetical protein
MFPTKAYFVLIPHSALHLVEEVSIDLAIDTLSFAEMPPSAIAATPILSHDTSAKWAFRQPAPFDYAQVRMKRIGHLPVEDARYDLPHPELVEGRRLLLQSYSAAARIAASAMRLANFGKSRRALRPTASRSAGVMRWLLRTAS